MKIISILLALLLAFSLCGCRKVEKGDDVSSTVVQTSSEKTSSKTSNDKKEEDSSLVVDPENCKHKLSAVKIEATCTADGRLTTSCGKCGFSEVKVIKAVGHIMISGECINCGYKDAVDHIKTVTNWLKTNENNKYVLSDTRYYISTLGKNITFVFNDGEKGSINISVYGIGDNLCHIEYSKGETIEGEFPMDSVHSSDYEYFSQMRGTAQGDQKEQLISELMSKIDDVLKTFDKALKQNTKVSIRDIGFISY